VTREDSFIESYRNRSSYFSFFYILSDTISYKMFFVKQHLAKPI